MTFTHIKTTFRYLSFIAAGLIIAGCATSPEPRFYVFTPDDHWQSLAGRDLRESEYVIRFMPVTIPRYLDRPQIVTRIDSSEVRADEFNRWGIPLDEAFAEILCAGLAAALPGAYVALTPWQGERDTDYLIQADVIRFDGTSGENVELVVQWQVFKPDSEPLAKRIGIYQRSVDGPGYENYTAAMKLAITDMVEEISGVIRGHIKEK